MTAAEWAAILSGAELVETPDEVRTADGELRRIVRHVLAAPDPVCVKCGTRCERCAHALPAGWTVIQRDELTMS